MLYENGGAISIGVFAGRAHFVEVTSELSKFLVRSSLDFIWRKGNVFQAEAAMWAKTETGWDMVGRQALSSRRKVHRNYVHMLS